MQNKIFMLIVLGLIAFSCKKEPIGQQPTDGVPPGPVTNISAKSIPGGAVFRYTLPEEEDLLYVKAIYSLKDGVMSESRASLYTDTLQIEGFGDTNPREVQLVAVDRSRNESEVATITITPLTPIIVSIGATLNLIEDFGGVHAYWDNPTRAEISVVLQKKDNNQDYVPIETLYSSMAIGDGAARGMDTIPADFNIFVQDRWENRSEVKYYTLTPIYETLFDRLKFGAIDLPGDAGAVSGWSKPNMWDDKKGETGYSSQGGTGIWPQSVTIDLGILGKVSRMKLFQRTGNSDDYIFAEGNLKEFKLYGAETLNMSGSWDDWTLLAECKSVKPSGLSLGVNSNEDITRAKEGEDFVIPPTAPKIRYLRILVTRTWAGGDNFQISELEFHGDNR